VRAAPPWTHSTNQPVLPCNGDIFVAEGHGPKCGNSRIVKFDKNGLV
jgi:hypothetical protein